MEIGVLFNYIKQEMALQKFIRVLKEDYRLYKRVKPCLDACDDKLSKRIIGALLNYHNRFLSNYGEHLLGIDCSYLRLHRKINRILNPIFMIPSLESINGKSIVVFGRGAGYRYTNSLLRRSDWRNNFRCIGNNLENLAGIKESDILVIAGNPYRDENLYNAIREKHPNIRILERDFLLVGQMRNQYLDVFEPLKEEHIIDCGAFNGETEWMFSNWGGKSIKKIYALELDPLNKNACLNYYETKGLTQIVEFINKGVSNTNSTIRIESSSMGSSGSHIGEGTVMAEVARLDDLIRGKVTFIKMDIEGAELDALNGAERIIKTQKPRLAICVYHKPDDIYEIPSYLLSLVPEYKFIVRHYSSYSWETVLYAHVPTKNSK